MEMKPGSRWKSAVCDTEIVVVRPPRTEITLECGGHPMVAFADAKPGGLTLAEEHAGGSGAGKRLTDPDTGLEVLCTKAGKGSLSIGGKAIDVKEAKKLPASD